MLNNDSIQIKIMHPQRHNVQVPDINDILWRLGRYFFTLLTLLLLTSSTSAQFFQDIDKQAFAFPMEPIQVDGRLDDWPKETITYEVDWVDPNTYRIRFPDGPDDFSGNFMVGYNKDQSILYVAVQVRDDFIEVVPDEPSIWNQDACAIYISTDQQQRFTPDNDIHLIYVMVPGDSKWTANQDGNPALNKCDTDQSGMKASYTVHDHMVTYEFSIPLYESYPDKRLVVQPGSTINFDMMLSDADESGGANFIWWTPYGGKSGRPGALGYLTFLENDRSLGEISGTMINQEGEPMGHVRFEVSQDGKITDQFKSREDGTYSFRGLPGQYEINTKHGQWITPQSFQWSLSAGQIIANQHIELYGFDIPGDFLRAGSIYNELQGYRDSVILILETDSQDGTSSSSSRQSFSFSMKKYNQLRFVGYGQQSPSLQIFADGSDYVVYAPEWKQFQKMGNYPWLLQSKNVFTNTRYDLMNILLSEDPQTALIAGIDEVRYLREDTVNGRQANVYEVNRSPDSYMKMTENPMTGHPFFSGGFPGPIQGMQDRIHIQYWFDTESGVILKTRNQITTPDGRISVQEVLHRSIEIDPEFREGYFSFEPDSGIVQVSQLTPPEILLHEQRLMDQKAPEFDLTDLHGKRVLMNEQHNKIVILNFWATWCGPCVQEIPMLNQLYKEYMDRGVVVLGISIDENVEVVQEFLEDHPVLYPVMLSNDEIESSYGPFRGIPTTFIIDRQGFVRKRILGYDGNPETLKEIIGDLL